VRLSPTLEGLRVYPFVRLTQAKNERVARGEQVVDFGIGEPREETPAFIRAALADAIEPMSTYPSADGLPELREAIAAWAGRRFAASLDPASDVVPTLGSKEAIFHLAQIVGPGRVAVTAPGYPVPERGALFAGREVVEAQLLA
jgi:aspartate/methionine/tyrosine aminotransferase